MRTKLKRIGSAFLSFAVSLQIFIGTTSWEGLSLTTSADTVNADGSKTVALDHCSLSRDNDKKFRKDITYMHKSDCKFYGDESSIWGWLCTCPTCGRTVEVAYYVYSAQVNPNDGGDHCWNCFYRYCDSRYDKGMPNFRHNVEYCIYGEWSKDSSNPTAKVWPLNVTTYDSLSYNIKVTHPNVIDVQPATKTDYVRPGNKVAISITGAQAGSKIKVTDTVANSERIVSVGANGIGVYSFVMPEKAMSFTVERYCTASASSITYGQSLNDSALTAENAPYAGHWEWDDPDITPSVSDSNSTSYAVSYIPDDNNNAVIHSTTKLAVRKFLPNITAEDIIASDITYGNTLADSNITCELPKLNGIDVTGSFAWENNTIAPNAGTPSYNVVFTPVDTANIETIMVSKQITVNKAPVVIDDDMRATVSAMSITYEQTLADSVLSGSVPRPGHYEWKHPDIVPTVADSNTAVYDVVFIPDDPNYADVDLTCMLSVSKKSHTFSDQDITNLSVSDLIYGQTLSESTISGTTPVAGSYRFINGSNVPTVNGTNNFAVEFVPADTDNYEISPVGDVHVTVNQADPIITAEQLAAMTVSEITYGQTLADSTITATPTTPGSFEWSDKTIAPAVANSLNTDYEITFTPDDTINYKVKKIYKTIKVNPAPIILSEAIKQSVTATGITYGDTLADSALTGDVPQAGHYKWVDNTIAPSVADSNRTAYDVVFVPDDENYANATLTVTLTISKKAYLPADFINIQASSIVYGQSLADSDITGNAPIQGSFKWVDEAITPTVSGTNNFAVKFVPIDTDNYEIVSIGDVHVTVTPATLVVTGTGIASGTYGDALNQLTISGLTVKFNGTEIRGSWSLVGTEIPNIPDSNFYTATFTPDENADCFNTLTTNVSLNIIANLIISPTNSGDELIYGTDYTYDDTTPRKLIILSSKPITIKNADPNVPISDTIKIAKDIDANINLAGVNINNTCAIEIEEGSTGDVTITLADGTNNILKSDTGHAGIEKNGNSEDIGKLIINGTGSLTVQGGENAAGIGGSNGKSAANIIIDNGNINTIGGANGAGIGGGANGNGSNITINGGTVNATGGTNAAGIGGGNGGNGENIVINNGTVNATGGENGAGIGGGANGNGTDITVNDGTVTATGGTNGAGIGGGATSNGENIVINNGTVIATGGENGAGIGGGQNGHGKDITLAGGNITATGGANASSIGGGSNGNLETLVITGGTIIATGGAGGAGIGGGANGTSADISITGGSISAEGGSYTEDGNIYTGAAIGSGVGRVNGVPVNGIPAEIVNEDQITHLLTINVPTDSTIIVDGQTIVTGLPNIGLLLEEPGPHTVTINDVTVNYIWSDHNNKWMIIPDVIAPIAKTNLKYTGNAQELITAGSTTGGTLEYSLAETEGYSTSIPTGTQANTYTIWYRVVGNDDYTDVAPVSIQVTISRKSSSGSSGGSSGGSSSGGSGSGSSSVTGNTLLNDKPATWNSIADEISKFSKGTSATISMNGETIIPSEVVKAINDTDSKITFKLDGVFSWLIDGADINSNEPIDLSINRISGVPTTGVDGIVGTQIKLNNNAIAGIDLGINFKKEYDNQFANLYKQTSEGLEFVTCSKICNTGYVLLEDVKYAGNYVVMLSQFSSKPGDINGDGFINAKDALAVLKHAVGIEAVRDAKMADVNHDGYINAKDALKILKVAIGLETM